MRGNIICTLLLILLCVGFVIAAKPDQVEADVIPSNGHASVTIPAHAAEKAPGVFDLGVVEVDGEMVQGYAFVHYDKAYGKPSGCNDDGVCQGWEAATCGDCSGGEDPGPTPDDASCYAFLAKGAKWKNIEYFEFNTDNNENLSSDYLMDNFRYDIAKWNDAAGMTVLGNGLMTAAPLVADTASPDGINEVYFGSIADPGAIAVTIVWGVFGGASKKRVLMEWDMIFDEVDFDWSTHGEPGKMDFESIATHELGHAEGMADLYEDACSAQTMYGYTSNGETNKRDLAAGDIAGIFELYD